MSRRELERRKFREALVPGLVLSAVAHALVLGLGHFGAPSWQPDEAPDRPEEVADRWQDRSLRVVATRSEPAPAAESRAASAAATSDGAPSRAAPSAADAGGADAPAPRTPSRPVSTGVALEPVEAPSADVALAAEGSGDEGRLTATDLAELFPSDGEMPEPASRAAREASGPARDVGDRFGAVGDTRRAAPRGGGCVVRPGAVINRRFPEGITVGGS